MSFLQRKQRGRDGRGGGLCALLAMAALLAGTLAVGLAPGTAGAQADLTVLGAHALSPSAAPGGELEIEFDVQNIGTTTTQLSGILNYVFLWDATVGAPVSQLSPTDTHIAHVLHALGPGEMQHLGPFPVTIPADAPLDTTLTIAVATDWADLEPEVNEDNNVATFPIAIAPHELVLAPSGAVVHGNVDLPYYGDVYEFVPLPGQRLFADVYAQRAGSTLDPRIVLLGPEPDSLAGSEGDIEEIGLDSRLSAELPVGGSARLDISGDDWTVSFFDVYLDVSQPEVEPNDMPEMATPLEVGRSVTGTLAVPGDVDWFSFDAQYGDMITIDVDSKEMFFPPDTMDLDPMVVLRGVTGDTLRLLDDQDEYDPRLFVILPTAGIYTVGITDAPGEGMGTGFPEYRYVMRLTRTEGYALPDLAVDGIGVVPGAVYPGDSVDVQWTTANQGGYATQAGGVSADIMLSPDAVIDPADEQLGVGDFEGDILPLGSIVTTRRILVPESTTPGPHFVGVVLDPTNDEVEGEEGNNTSAAVPVTVLQPGDVSPGEPLPLSFALLPPRPNPCRGSVAIEYHVPAGTTGQSVQHRVKVEILSVAGQRVATLVDGPRPSGVYRMAWRRNANTPPGMYFLRIVSGGFARTERMVLLD